MKKAKVIIDELADKAFIRRFVTDGIFPSEKPGQIIEHLSEKERAELAKLTSDDLQNVRWPRPDGMNLEKMPRRLK